MNGYIVHGIVAMPRGSLARIEDGRGMLVYAWEGELWITQERDRRDYFVKPGGWFLVDREGAVIIDALRRSRLTLTAPVESHYAKRISLALPESSAPHVLYDRAGEPGRGWLAYVRSRLVRLWTSAFSADAKPTTAAL